MTVVPTRPTGSSVSASTNVGAAQGGAASRHAALADNDDATYVDIPPRVKDGASVANRKKNTLTLTFGAPSPPSGAKLKEIFVQLKVAHFGSQAPKVQVRRETADREKKGGKIIVVADSHRPPKTTPTLSPKMAVRATGTVPNVPTLTIVGAENAGRPDVSLYEVFYNYTYVEKPVATVTAPDGSIGSSLPLVSWVQDVDTDGGARTHYQVKVFSSAQYGAGGFDPTSSTATKNSGSVADPYATAYQLQGAQLADGTYRAYVRIAQTVNNEIFFGDWDYLEFTVASTRPGVPTSVTATADDANARISLSATKVAATSGPPAVAASDFIEFQRSTDNGTTWEDIRTVVGDGRVAPGATTATAYDYEVGNGVSAIYRARAVKNFATEVDDAVSDYSSSTAAVSWDSTDWWLKNPLLPSQNTKVYIDSLSEETQGARQGVFQAIGATNTVVVSDTRQAKSGSVTFRVDTDAEKTDLDALVQEGTPLLLQGVPGQHWDDRYISIGDYSRVRAPDKSFVEATLDTTTWTEVEAPDANLGE